MRAISFEQVDANSSAELASLISFSPDTRHGSGLDKTYFFIVSFLSDEKRRRSDATVLFGAVTRGPPACPVPSKYSWMLSVVRKCLLVHRGN